MKKVKVFYFYEEDGHFFLADCWELTRVMFSSTEDRQKWLECFCKNNNVRAKIIEGKPDVGQMLRQIFGNLSLAGDE